MRQKTAKFLRRTAYRIADPTRNYRKKVKRLKGQWVAKNHKERGEFRGYHEVLTIYHNTPPAKVVSAA